MLSGKDVNFKGKNRCFVGNTIQAEELDSFFRNKGKSSAKAGKKTQDDITKNYGRTLGFGAKFGNATVSKNVRAALSTTPELITFYKTKK